MNAIARLQAGAGQRIHERIYGAIFIWNNVPYPCTHGDITMNPPLMEGGFSPDTTVIISVDGSAFGDGVEESPKKGDYCFLQVDPDQSTVRALQVGTVMTSVGDVVWKAVCVDVNQGA